MALGPNDTALVTGASSGIGAATVRALRAHDVEVHAVARRADQLHDLQDETGCIPHLLDVRNRDLVDLFGSRVPIDYFVNNAGLGRGIGSMWDASVDDIERTVDTNVTAAIHFIKVLLPGMIERGKGHIVNMSSVTALHAAPMALYGATKGAMHLLSQDLRLELAGTGVRVTEICPGRVTTEFYDVAIDDPDRVAEIKDHGCVELLPSDIADAIVYALGAPWRVNVSLMEIQPTEQTYGGATFTPVPGNRSR